MPCARSIRPRRAGSSTSMPKPSPVPLAPGRGGGRESHRGQGAERSVRHCQSFRRYRRRFRRVRPGPPAPVQRTGRRPGASRRPGRCQGVRRTRDGRCAGAGDYVAGQRGRVEQGGGRAGRGRTGRCDGRWRRSGIGGCCRRCGCLWLCGCCGLDGAAGAAGSGGAAGAAGTAGSAAAGWCWRRRIDWRDRRGRRRRIDRSNGRRRVGRNDGRGRRRGFQFRCGSGGRRSAAASVGAASGAAQAAASGASAPEGKSAADQKPSDLLAGAPSWLTDNLLVIVTAVLALLVFIIAWALRARRRAPWR